MHISHITKGNYMKKNKKAFTLIEIILALVISAFIGVYILNQKSYSNFKDSVEAFGKKLTKIISIGVLDNVVGYANGNGAPCGDNKNYFDNIKASKVVECVGWDDKYDTIDNGGSDNYMYGVRLLGAYTNGIGCKIYIDTTGTNTTKFNLFVDCSGVDYKNDDRYLKYVENRLEYILKLDTQVGDMIESIEHNATGVFNTSGGDEKDGKILFKFDSSLH